jgi:hypothetical protein
MWAGDLRTPYRSYLQRPSYSGEHLQGGSGKDRDSDPCYYTRDQGRLAWRRKDLRSIQTLSEITAAKEEMVWPYR